ncbi:MAG: iron ABC transporter permease [Oleispira sp.]|nr:iron ABC transporter permease [Oleispira sp.]
MVLISKIAAKENWNTRLVFYFLVIVLLVFFSSLLSLKLGQRAIEWGQIMQVFSHYDPYDSDHVIIRHMRLPRLFAALLVGASLAVAGVLMQTISRNPLADPGIIGINAGAALAVVIAVVLLGSASPAVYIWPALGCAGLATVSVFLLSGSGQAGASPARLVLAGAAISALLFALVRAVLLVSQQSLEVYRQWITGSLQIADSANLLALMPFFIVGFALALVCSLLIDALSMGDDIARGLGVKVRFAKGLCMVTITLLCSASVALVGPIGFIGLVVPHAARFLVGNNGRWLILIAALLGAGLLLLADVIGRVILTNSEIPAGLMVALMGGLAFIFLVRQKEMVRL